jgi:hypothetical protein
VLSYFDKIMHALFSHIYIQGKFLVITHVFVADGKNNF